MKSLSDFQSREDKSVPHLISESEGSDDKEFHNLMGQYKDARRFSEDPKGANKLLRKAMGRGHRGKVSRNAKILAAYL